MPITEAIALDYNSMVHFAQTRQIPFAGNRKQLEPGSFDAVKIISITDHDLPKIFVDGEHVLTLVFSDIDAQNPDYEPPADSHYMTKDHAKQIIDFLEKIHALPEKVLLMVNCKHGQCRSGAVVDFAGTVYGLGFWEQHRKNPQLVPNYWVRYRLFEEYFKRKLSQP